MWNSLIFTIDFIMQIYLLQTILRKVHLEEKRNVRMKNLSYSEQRRIQFARLLIQNPKQFIFEEPDQNIDIETQRVLIIMLEELRAKGKMYYY